MSKFYPLDASPEKSFWGAWVLFVSVCVSYIRCIVFVISMISFCLERTKMVHDTALGMRFLGEQVG